MVAGCPLPPDSPILPLTGRCPSPPAVANPPQLTKYQEQPQLLDGCLEAIVQPLAVLLRDHATGCANATACTLAASAAAALPAEGTGGPHSGGADVAAVAGVCRLLHVLATVRGHKTVVRFFPHEAADLERALQVGRGWGGGCSGGQRGRGHLQKGRVVGGRHDRAWLEGNRWRDSCW
jgi:hypothetical protein